MASGYTLVQQGRRCSRGLTAVLSTLLVSNAVWIGGAVAQQAAPTANPTLAPANTTAAPIATATVSAAVTPVETAQTSATPTAASTPTATEEDEGDEHQPRVNLEPINQEQFDVFLDSIRSSVPLKLPQGHFSQRIDPNIGGIWAGSKTNVESRIEDIVLRFRRKAEELVAPSIEGEVATEKLLEQFDFTVSQERKWLFMQHSNPIERRELYGVQVRVDKPNVAAKTPFFKGQRDSGMYVSIPPLSDQTVNWGILVCPRRLVREKHSASGLPEYVLGPSAYELSEVKLNMSVKADAVMSTAGQEGRTNITLHLTRDMPASTFSSDESISTVPRVTLAYKPRQPFDFFRFAPYNDVQQGNLVTVEMQNKAGYLRRENYSHALYIHKMVEPSPISVVADGRRVSHDTGECYAVVVHKYMWIEYEKGEAKF